MTAQGSPNRAPSPPARTTRQEQAGKRRWLSTYLPHENPVHFATRLLGGAFWYRAPGSVSPKAARHICHRQIIQPGGMTLATHPPMKPHTYAQRRRILIGISRIGTVGATLLLAAGCGSAATPNAEFADTRAAIAEAEGTGAQAVPEASLYLKMAHDGVEQAEEQMREEQNEEATATLERAKADAKLAKSLTNEAKVREEADLALDRIKDLQSQSIPST